MESGIEMSQKTSETSWVSTIESQVSFQSSIVARVVSWSGTGNGDATSSLILAVSPFLLALTLAASPFLLLSQAPRARQEDQHVNPRFALESQAMEFRGPPHLTLE